MVNLGLAIIGRIVVLVSIRWHGDFACVVVGLLIFLHMIGSLRFFCHGPSQCGTFLTFASLDQEVFHGFRILFFDAGIDGRTMGYLLLFVVNGLCQGLALIVLVVPPAINQWCCGFAAVVIGVGVFLRWHWFDIRQRQSVTLWRWRISNQCHRRKTPTPITTAAKPQHH